MGNLPKTVQRWQKKDYGGTGFFRPENDCSSKSVNLGMIRQSFQKVTCYFNSVIYHTDLLCTILVPTKVSKSYSFFYFCDVSHTTKLVIEGECEGVREDVG